ncbi:MAG: hypothetical protein ACYSWQ_14005, partial [Planctomycetota bacterium]
FERKIVWAAARNLGSQGGNSSRWGPERFFSVVGIAMLDTPIMARIRRLAGMADYRNNGDRQLCNADKAAGPYTA